MISVFNDRRAGGFEPRSQCLGTLDELESPRMVLQENLAQMSTGASHLLLKLQPTCRLDEDHWILRKGKLESLSAYYRLKPVDVLQLLWHALCNSVQHT
jgi:hypothetical protein